MIALDLFMFLIKTTGISETRITEQAQGTFVLNCNVFLMAFSNMVMIFNNFENV